MRHFFETTFGPAELKVLNQALDDWKRTHGVANNSPDLEIAAAVVLNLFREGNRDPTSLRAALGAHKGLGELTSMASAKATPGTVPASPH